jgi:hypothetical protein
MVRYLRRMTHDAGRFQYRYIFGADRVRLRAKTRRKVEALGRLDPPKFQESTPLVVRHRSFNSKL